MNKPRFKRREARARRAFRGMSLADVRDALAERGYACSAATLSRWEAGHAEPPREAVSMLARVLRCRVGDLT